MSGTVLLTVLAELIASWIPAGTFGLPWHACRLLPCIAKAPEERCPSGLCEFHLARFR
jgi:hypothetical protein